MGISGSNTWRYVSTIFLGIFSRDIPLHRPKKSALYMVGTSNQSVPEMAIEWYPHFWWYSIQVYAIFCWSSTLLWPSCLASRAESGVKTPFLAAQILTSCDVIPHFCSTTKRTGANFNTPSVSKLSFSSKPVRGNLHIYPAKHNNSFCSSVASANLT